MKPQSVTRDIFLGTVLGFAIEFTSSLGASRLAAFLYQVGGITINADPFIIVYPLMCVAAIAAYLSIAKKAYAMSSGIAVGFVLALVILILMLRGA